MTRAGPAGGAGVGLALLGLWGPLAFTVAVILVAELRPGYDHAAQFMSELGEAGRPHSGIMRVLGFLAGGAMVLGYARGLGAETGPGSRGRLAAWLVGLLGLTMIVAGYFPCDRGGPVLPSSLAGLVHNLAAFPTFGLVWLAPFLFGADPAVQLRWPRLARGSRTLAAALGLVLVLLAQATFLGGPLRGLWQRVYLAGMFGWLGATAVAILLEGEADSFDWPQRMGRHQAYHRALPNRVIHWLCIPLELWGILGVLARLPLGPGPDCAQVAIVLAAPFLVATEPLLGSLAVAGLLGLRALAGGIPGVVAVATPGIPLGVAALAFAVQTRIGHGRFEPGGRDDTALNLAELAATRDPVPLVLVFYYHLVEVALAAGYRPALAARIRDHAAREVAGFEPPPAA